MKGSFEKGAFELKAENNVQAIGDLVCMDAYQRGMDAVERSIKCVKGNFLEGGEGVLKFRIDKLAKRDAHADERFPEARLAFMHAKRGDIGKRRSKGGFRKILFIESVSSFMKHCGEVVDEI